jgi:hypothetical protein
LRVERVEEDGAIRLFNKERPRDALLVNDCIVAVNCVRGNPVEMLSECEKKEVLDIEVRPCTEGEWATTATRTFTSTNTTTSTTSTSTTTFGCPACAPRYRDAIDVVIPFFERDLCKLKYTAKSISLYDPNHYLGDVYLMWVSFKPPWQFQAEIDEIKRYISQTREAIFIDFSQTLASEHDLLGWYAQQVVKLKVASWVRSSFYLVLDTKNALIQEVKADTFFTECNQARILADYPFDGIPAPHRDWYKLSAQALHVNPPDRGYWPASISPVVIGGAHRPHGDGN